MGKKMKKRENRKNRDKTKKTIIEKQTEKRRRIKKEKEGNRR